MEIMEADGLTARVIRAGNDNLFRSKIFGDTVATLTNKQIEIYDTTGAIGAARACALSDSGGYDTFSSFTENDHVMTLQPMEEQEPYKMAYGHWKRELECILQQQAL
jgi:xylulokinase